MTQSAQPNTNKTPKYGRSNDERIIPFMKIARPAVIISILLTIISVICLATRGLNLGLEFTGGVSAEIVYTNPVQPNAVTAALKQAGFHDPVVQNLGSQRDLMLRLPAQNNNSLEQVSQQLTRAIQLPNNPARIQKIDLVGGQVGAELYKSSFAAVALSLLLMLIYVSIRFEFKIAVGAVLSLFHDVIVTLGLFSLFGWPFDLTVLAALLALIGFSLNDNIVVSDRIRENFRKIRGAEPVEVIDISLTETLRRTINTTMTLLLVVLAMFLVGGDGLKWFSVTFLVGLFVGTYSSIYIGTAYALWKGLNRQDFIVQVKPEFDEEGIR